MRRIRTDFWTTRRPSRARGSRKTPRPVLRRDNAHQYQYDPRWSRLAATRSRPTRLAFADRLPPPSPERSPPERRRQSRARRSKPCAGGRRAAALARWIAPPQSEALLTRLKRDLAGVISYLLTLLLIHLAQVNSQFDRSLLPIRDRDAPGGRFKPRGLGCLPTDSEPEICSYFVFSWKQSVEHESSFAVDAGFRRISIAGRCNPPWRRTHDDGRLRVLWQSANEFHLPANRAARLGKDHARSRDLLPRIDLYAVRRLNALKLDARYSKPFDLPLIRHEIDLPPASPLRH